MRLHRERIPTIAKTIVSSLLSKELIAVDSQENVAEVELDIESVLKEYRRMDNELTEKAKDLVATRGLDYSQTFKTKSKLAQERGFGLNDDAVDWLANQMVELLMQSKYVDEVFGEDNELRAALSPILKRELNVESDLDKQVKKQIRNLQEGTQDYEIEYRKAMEQVRSMRKLED